METVNGYTVIAEKPDGDGNRIIVAAIDTRSGFEYVVARALPAERKPTGWMDGYYTDDFLAAAARFDSRGA